MSNLDLKCFFKNQIYFHKFHIRKLKLINIKKTVNYNYLSSVLVIMRHAKYLSRIKYNDKC